MNLQQFCLPTRKRLEYTFRRVQDLPALPARRDINITLSPLFLSHLPLFSSPYSFPFQPPYLISIYGIVEEDGERKGDRAGGIGSNVELECLDTLG